MERKIPINQVRVALCGASGSGKSTLATFISEFLGVPYTENSAGLLLTPEQQEMLVQKYGWTKTGHKDVIRLSNANPRFAWDFQMELLKTRSLFIAQSQSFVIDRSPVDNIAYFLLQTAHLVEPKVCDYFIATATQAMEPITHLIYLPTGNTSKWVEENGSRIANYPYQRMVSSVFKHVITEYMVNNFYFRGSFMEINVWDLDTRKNMLNDWFLSTIEF